MEERYTTYKGIRIDDTAAWHLAIYISQTGLSSYLKNIENPLDPVLILSETEWKYDDTSLLSNIEGAIYDNPQLLDDFSTDIVVCSPHSLWIPSEFAGDKDSVCELYSRVYRAEVEDLFLDRVGDMVNVSTLAPGLPAFLRRTLSGSRVYTQQGILASVFSERGVEMPRLYIDLYSDKADTLLFDGKRLICGATHSWREISDIVYHALNILDVYNINKKECQISISGLRDVKTELMKDLRKYVECVMLTMVPTSISKINMPLSAAFAISRLKSMKR